MFVELEEILDRLSTCVITVVMNFHDEMDRHVKRMNTSIPAFNCTLCGKGCTRSINLEVHMRTCTGVAVGSSTPAHTGGAASCSSTPVHRGGSANTQARSFTVRRKRRALWGAVEVHIVDMDAANQLVALEDAVLAPEPTMTAYQQRHRAYKYQIALNVVFHKAVDPTILTDPPVTLRTTMAAVYPSELHQLKLL